MLVIPKLPIKTQTYLSESSSEYQSFDFVLIVFYQNGKTAKWKMATVCSF